MFVTFDGIVIDDKLVQLQNAYDPINATFTGIVKEGKILHP